MRTTERLGLILASLLAFGAFETREVGAHPVAQGALDIVVLPDRVRVTARVSMEEVLVAAAHGAIESPLGLRDGASTWRLSARASARRRGWATAHGRLMRVLRAAGRPTYELEYRGVDGCRRASRSSRMC